MSCINCTKYKGNCGYHFIDWDGHICWDIPKEAYTDRCGNCNYYEPKEVEHTFTFKTPAGWKAGEGSCWVNCPFSFNIKLNDRCKCLETDIQCPFIKK